MTGLLDIGDFFMITSQATQDIAWFKKCLADEKLVAALKNIKLVISDVDGTLADTTVYVDQGGEGRTH